MWISIDGDSINTLRPTNTFLGWFCSNLQRIWSNRNTNFSFFLQIKKSKIFSLDFLVFDLKVRVYYMTEVENILIVHRKYRKKSKSVRNFFIYLLRFWVRSIWISISSTDHKYSIKTYPEKVLVFKIQADIRSVLHVIEKFCFWTQRSMPFIKKLVFFATTRMGPRN